MIKKCARDSYGKALVEYGSKNSKVVVVVADVSSSVKTDYFAKSFPDRFFNVGIAEQALVDVSVGLSLEGFIPFANTFAGLFLRAVEQIRTCVCYAKTNVKIIGGYAGLSDFKDGATHHSITDIAIMRSLPNMTVVSPADAVEIEKMIPLIGEYNGPVYMRISRAELPVIFDADHKIEIGKGVVVREGKDVTLIGTGIMVYRCLEAAEILSKEGIDTRVINIHTIKPIDTSLIMKSAKETGAIVTAEEHSVIGGLGSAVVEVTSKNYPVPVEQVGICDTFAVTGSDHDSLLDCYGMSIEDIVKKTKIVIERKKNEINRWRDSC